MSQVENLIADGLDAVIVKPVDSDSTAEIPRLVTEAGIIRVPFELITPENMAEQK